MAVVPDSPPAIEDLPPEAEAPLDWLPGEATVAELIEAAGVAGYTHYSDVEGGNCRPLARILERGLASVFGAPFYSLVNLHVMTPESRFVWDAEVIGGMLRISYLQHDPHRKREPEWVPVAYLMQGTGNRGESPAAAPATLACCPPCSPCLRGDPGSGKDGQDGPIDGVPPAGP